MTPGAVIARLRTRLQRLQTRLTVLYAALFGAVMLASCALTWISVASQAQRAVETQLAASGGVFDSLWRDRVERVRGSAEVLAKDFGFRSALASHDAPTLSSALENLRNRLKLDEAAAFDVGGAPLTAGGALSAKVGAALAATGEASGVAITGNTPWEVVSTPIYAPELQGWLSFATKLDDAQMRALSRLSAIPLTAEVVRAEHGRWVGRDGRPVEGLSFPNGPERAGVMRGARGIDYAVLRPLDSAEGGARAALLLHYSKAAALAPYTPLLWTVIALAAAGMALVVLGSWGLARSITRPIASLAGAVRRFGEGEATHVEVQGGGEVGALAGGFNAMIDAVAEREAHIRRAAVVDAESGLANRLALQAHLEGLGPAGGGGVFVAAFGVNQFARMRGVIGHELTTELLRNLGTRLQALQPGWRIARTAGDTLSATIVGGDVEQAATEAEAARQVLEAAVPVGGHLIDVRVSMGLSHGEPRHLIRDAELALDAARHRNTASERFDPVARARAAESLGLMPELRRALARDGLALAHQPKWDVREGRVTAVESLIRWTHPQRGPIRPDSFIGLAESTGDIRGLTDWVVLRTVDEQARLAAQGCDLAFSLNLSGRLVGDVQYTRWLLDALAKARGKVCLEITETAVIGNPQAAMASFRAFAEAGIGVSIDDYGSGLSSLAYLKQIEADELKLDRSLIMDVARSARDALLIRSTIDLAHGLGMKVTAEGVEDGATMALLAGMGCDMIQGWHVAKPMSLDRLARYLADQAAASPPRRAGRAQAG